MRSAELLARVSILFVAVPACQIGVAGSRAEFCVCARNGSLAPSAPHLLRHLHDHTERVERVEVGVACATLQWPVAAPLEDAKRALKVGHHEAEQVH
eukprot:2137127-Prymnesium_polylepis.2